MDRNQQAAGANLEAHEGRIMDNILNRYARLINLATQRITDKASAGQASYTSMAMELETQSFVKAIEDLLALTWQLRELWVVGPLRKPGEGEQEAEETIDTEVQRVTQILNQLRGHSRQQMVSEGGGYGQFVMGPMEQSPPRASDAVLATSTNETAAAPSQ